MPERTIAPWYSLTGDVYHVRSDCDPSKIEAKRYCCKM